jgi:hypothetical protein
MKGTRGLPRDWNERTISDRYRGTRESGANREARLSPADRTFARLPAYHSRPGLSSSRPCPHLLRQATGPARGHGSKQFTDPRQRIGSVLISLALRLHAMVSMTATAGCVLENHATYWMINMSRSTFFIHRQGHRGQNHRLDPGEAGPKNHHPAMARRFPKLGSQLPDSARHRKPSSSVRLSNGKQTGPEYWSSVFRRLRSCIPLENHNEH